MNRRLMARGGLLLALLGLIGCASPRLLPERTTYRAVEAGREVVLSRRQDRWLCYASATPDGQLAQYTWLSARSFELLPDSLLMRGLCASGPVSEAKFLTVRCISNPLSQSPLPLLLVDALGGPDTANLSGARADSNGVALLPRNWQPAAAVAAQRKTPLARVDTTMRRFSFTLPNGKDTAIFVRSSSLIDVNKGGGIKGPAHTLEVAYRGTQYRFRLDSLALTHDLVVSLGLGLMRSLDRPVIRPSKEGITVTWLGRRWKMRPSQVGLPAWCE